MDGPRDLPNGTEVADSIVADVSPGPVAGPVLSRAASAIAARVQLTLDRINDASLIMESLAAHGASHTPDGRVRVTFTGAPGCLTIRLGPLSPGGGRAVLADATLPGLGPVLERLADDVIVLAHRAEEYLQVTVGRAPVK